MFKIARLKTLRFHQKFLSPSKSPVYRYYPTCSEHVLWQFQKGNCILTFFSSFFRILKCNPFFKGGFDYPKVTRNITSCNLCFKPIFLAQKQLYFLYIPYHQDESFYLVKIIFQRTNK